MSHEGFAFRFFSVHAVKYIGGIFLEACLASCRKRGGQEVENK